MAKSRESKLNCLIAVDKPCGCTSHDVVYRVRRAVGERRVGHAGTLDPDASGVMVVGIGAATRLLGLLTADTKSYCAQIEFGSETNTDDAEGEVTRTAEVAACLSNPEYAAQVCSEMVGRQLQVPPAFSAISVNGVRSYKAAREGKTVELAARPIEVYAAVLLNVDTIDGKVVWNVAFSVSKGTYIRALARDLGRKVGSAAHLCGLRRNSSGKVSLGDCLSLDELSADVALEHALDPVKALDLDVIELGMDALEDIRCGRTISKRKFSAAAEQLLEKDSSYIDEPKRVALLINRRLYALAYFDGFCLKMKEVFPSGIEGVVSE